MGGVDERRAGLGLVVFCPYPLRILFLARSAGACPPRSLTRAKNARRQRPFPARPQHGEGQALALR